MILPILTSFIYKEHSGRYFIFCATIGFLIGWLMTRKKPKNTLFYAREGFISVALSWILLSVHSAMPFWLSGEIPHLIDALFEVVSGFTTTGASILSDVEALSKGMLLWRSFTHWIGGMGVLVFVLAILPMSGGQSINIMRAESPGPSVGKLVPKIQQTASILYSIYFAMTLLEILLLVLGKMPMFEAICTSFGTAGTGGFGVKNDSMGSYSPYIQNVVTIFMFLFGVNFNFYYLLLIHKLKDAFSMEEVKWYFIIWFVSTFAIAVNLTSISGSFLYNLHHSAFQTASIMTTTGFSTIDFDLWPEFARIILVILMFIGACAGSTGGGIKVSRIIMYIKTVGKELLHVTHPRSIKVIKMDGKAIDLNILRSTNVFLIAYFLIFVSSVILVSIEDYDIVTSSTAVAATLNNIGPGLGLVGPTCNFGFFRPFTKLVLIFDMLAGRLELFPMLVLFSPTAWRRK